MKTPGRFVLINNRLWAYIPVQCFLFPNASHNTAVPTDTKNSISISLTSTTAQNIRSFKFMSIGKSARFRKLTNFLQLSAHGFRVTS